MTGYKQFLYCLGGYRADNENAKATEASATSKRSFIAAFHSLQAQSTGHKEVY